MRNYVIILCMGGAMAILSAYCFIALIRNKIDAKTLAVMLARDAGESKFPMPIRWLWMCGTFLSAVIGIGTSAMAIMKLIAIMDA